MPKPEVGGLIYPELKPRIGLEMRLCGLMAVDLVVRSRGNILLL